MPSCSRVRLSTRSSPRPRPRLWRLNARILHQCRPNQGEEMHSNKAAVPLANKLARIAWAVWHHERDFDGNHVVRVAA
jgi:hypothetical protein